MCLYVFVSKSPAATSDKPEEAPEVDVLYDYRMCSLTYMYLVPPFPNYNVQTR